MLSISSVLLEKEIRDSFSIQRLTDEQFGQTSAFRLTYNRILLIKAGIGAVNIDETAFEILPNQLFIIAKGQVIRFKSGTEWTGYELCFGDCFWERSPSSASNCKAVLFNNASANQVLSLTEHDHEELMLVFKNLWQEFEKEEYINKLDAMAAYLKIIMIKMANVHHALANGFDSYEHQVYRQFLELISQHYQRSREVADYAKLLSISARKLADISKGFSGKGAKELINEQIVAEAKRALQFSSRPIKEIAFELNFATPEQFSHFFKKNAQVSPQGYRTLFLKLGA